MSEPKKTLTLTFTLDEVEMGIRNKWLEEHSKKCALYGPATAGWFGSPYHYVFTPWGCGTGKEIKCNCGESQSLNDPNEEL